VSVPTVLIAHGDGQARDILARACTAHDVSVVGQTADAREVVALCAAHEPDVAVLGDRLDDIAIDSALEELVEMGTRVVVLSADPSPDRLAQLLGHGARGYFFHDSSPSEVAMGIHAVARGGAAINPSAGAILLAQWRRLRRQPVSISSHRHPVLTRREREVLAAMADGLATKALAARLGIAVKTAENHKIRIFEKLGVRSQAHAVTVALSLGVVAGTADGNAKEVNGDRS
jgi:DNA-binding NarL/FixJ family response regulator